MTTEAWSEVVSSWGGRAELVHEPPPSWHAEPARVLTEGRRPSILFIGIFGGDEPVDEVVCAARSVPEIDIRITGDIARRPTALSTNKPVNVEYTGYLSGEAFASAVSNADVVLALTTEPTSVMRAAYEAVYSMRPLVISDTPALRGLFPSAVFVNNDAASIAAGLRAAITNHTALMDQAARARNIQIDRWAAQLAALQSAL